MDFLVYGTFDPYVVRVKVDREKLEKLVHPVVMVIMTLGKNIVTGSSLIQSYVIRTVDNIQPSKSDFDKSVFICAKGSKNNFDIMEWWKENTLKFRILSKMACKILSIPITSVASEFTFSVGGKVIDPYRASLLPEIVQVLLCGVDGVRVLHGLKKGSEVEIFWEC
ncbi:hypothetical protein F0562_002110 [Nyssa sinensis]|uniref:HAT C-terminal dimerisation domain-containing protein n=1 Tax=Nyssa sinensis TaxID=561372 RepID=A0A5J5C638_9ASTE|nr:hypothetical protein F0562_002110 [Nyssa sinensis]